MAAAHSFSFACRRDNGFCSCGPARQQWQEFVCVREMMRWSQGASVSAAVRHGTKVHYHALVEPLGLPLLKTSRAKQASWGLHDQHNTTRCGIDLPA
jgi:hypothetical protein